MTSQRWTWQLHDFYDRVERETLAALPQPGTPEEWQAQKPALREVLAKAIGFRPDLLPKVEAERLGTTQREGYTVERIVFYGWPNAPISANLYMPDGVSAPVPAILAPHGHSMDGKAYEVYQHCHINLARRGYVVLAWDMIGYGEREAMGHKDAYWFLLPGLSLKGAMLTEAQALLTWLMEQEEVDRERIGCTGNSGGGAQTLLLAALDTRITAAAPGGHVSPLSFIAGKEKNLCACAMLPHTIAIAEIEHILGLIAPRACLIVSGRNDCLFPDDLVRRAHRLGRRFYALEGVPDRLELYVGPCEHGYEQPKREAMYAFFDRVLKDKEVEEVSEPPTEPEPPDSPVLRCWHGPRPTFCTARELAQHIAGKMERDPSAKPDLWSGILGIRNETKVVQAETIGECDGWEQIAIALNNGIELPALRDVPERKERAAIIIDDQGMDSDRARECADAVRQEGGIVLRIDLLGWGETKPAELAERGDDETVAAQRGLFFGRPLPGERVAELVAVTRWLIETYGLGRGAVTWHAFGWAGLITLLASAAKRPTIGGALKEIRLHDFPIRSFWDETDTPRPLSTFTHNILAIGDIPDLASDIVSFEVAPPT